MAEESLFRFLEPMPGPIMAKILKMKRMTSYEELYRDNDLKSCIQYLEGRCEYARQNYERSLNPKDLFLTKPTDEEFAAVKKKFTFPKLKQRPQPQTKGPGRSARFSKGRSGDLTPEVEDVSSGSDEKPTPRILHSGFSDTRDVDDLANQLKSMHLGNTELNRFIRNIQKFADTGSTLPKRKNVRFSDTAIKPQLNTLSHRSVSDLEEDSCEEYYSSWSDSSVEVNVITTGDEVQRPYPPEGIRCRYCFFTGHVMKECRAVVRDCEAKITQKVGPDFTLWEAGTSGNRHSYEEDYLPRILIGRTWILQMYKVIGVRAAILIWLYAAGEIYGWNFPGAKQARKFRGGPEGDTVPWDYAQDLDWAVHIKPSCYRETLVARQINLPDAFARLQKTHPHFSHLRAEDVMSMEILTAAEERGVKRARTGEERRDNDHPMYERGTFAPVNHARPHTPGQSAFHSTNQRLRPRYDSAYAEDMRARLVRSREKAATGPDMFPKPPQKPAETPNKSAGTAVEIPKPRRTQASTRSDTNGQRAATRAVEEDTNIKLSILQYAALNPGWRESMVKLLKDMPPSGGIEDLDR